MPVQMMLIAKTHDALHTLIAFLMSMRDHMPPEMRIPLESFLARLDSTDKIP
jgi:hypothetical protein